MTNTTPTNEPIPSTGVENNLIKNKTLKIITVNINGGWEDKKAKLQEWTNKHHPDIIMVQELKCDKTKGRYATLDGYKGFHNCLSQRYIQKSQVQTESEEEQMDMELELPTKNKPLVHPLATHRLVAKWGTAVLIHKDLTGLASDITPTENWAKGRISAVKIITNNNALILVSVYAPAARTKEKHNFYKRLTEWTKEIKGDKVLGGDWNMTLDQKDQKIGTYKKEKNKLLHTFK
jgi:exonuclease III